MKTDGLPRRYPAPALDQFMHLARYLDDGQCRAVLTFSGCLDSLRIARAIRLTMDAEPILGCRFVARWLRPFWERRGDLEQTLLFRVLEPENMDEAISAFLGEPLNPAVDLPVQVCLFRGPVDSMGIKLSHEAADAAGLLEYTELLGRIYRRLAIDPGYHPSPPSIDCRGQWPVLCGANPSQLLRGCIHSTYPVSALDFPISRETTAGRTFASRRLSAEGVGRVRRYCHERKVSTHDVLVAAFYRAHFALLRTPPSVPLRAQITVNLRRHLPTNGARRICNLSGAFFPSVKNQGFDETVTDVRRIMALARANTPWLGGSITVEALSRLPYNLLKPLCRRLMERRIGTGKTLPSLANIGVIDIQRFNFGDVAVSGLALFSPVPQPPGSILCLYTIDNALTATTCTWDSPDGHNAEDLLDAFFDQLPGQESQVTSWRSTL